MKINNSTLLFTFIIWIQLISSRIEVIEAIKLKSNSKSSFISRLEKRSITSEANSILIPQNESGEEESVETKPEIKNENPKKQTSHFKLPPNYNKLEVPAFDKELFLEKLKSKANKSLTSKENEAIEKYAQALDDNMDESIPLKVYVLLRSIREVDEIDEEITVELDFMASWLDMHLCIENDCFRDQIQTDQFNIAKQIKSVDPIFLRDIWKPDLFIENVVKISRPELISKPTKLLFSPKGFIILQTRVTLKMDCEMKFHYYPADTQHCVFKIRSYSHTTKEIDMDWDIDEEVPRHGVFIADRSENNFDIKVDSVKSSEKIEWEDLLHKNYSEKYKILEFTVSCRRKLSYHLIQTYLPSVFFIIITWLCFLVPSTMVEARIGVSMTTLLTLTSMFAAVRESTPVVSYVKAIDIWMVACIFAVFLTLLEFTILIWLRHTHKENSSASKEGIDGSHLKLQDLGIRRQIDNDRRDFDNLEPLNTDHEQHKVLGGFIPGATHFNNKEKTANWIEKHAFSLFSILFFIFNIIYWSWLLNSSSYFVWEVNPLYNTAEED